MKTFGFTAKVEFGCLDLWEKLWLILLADLFRTNVSKLYLKKKIDSRWKK